jgi:CubicO group peptidase (beta-lactamase class C family)
MTSPVARRRIAPALHRLAAVAILIAAGAGAQQPGPTLVPTRPSKAAPEGPAALPQTPATTAQLTTADLDAFLEGVIPLQLQKGDIAGAVVTVVKDGKVIFAKGYGYSDVARRTPVTTDATLFRIGSVSKTFTWTAVMQLVEQGKIDLDRDVNAYIDFKIPATFGKPVTMRNLMTHTPGFEEVIKDLMVPSNLRPMKEWLPSHLPRQIYPPGTTPAYSNYGATVAAYVVERVSGMPFETYMAKNIFGPLQLTRTTFAQPLPPQLAPLLSKGYRLASQAPKPFEIVQTPPAGSVSTTAENMSRYMIAYLEDGGAQLMKPETKRLMFSRAFGTAPELHGMAHGFYEESRNGHRIVGHGGDTQWFHSDMHFMPDDHVGFFVSYNSAGNGKADGRGALWRAFLDRYFPYVTPTTPTTATNLAHGRAVVGTYESSRRAETTITSMISMLGQSKVAVNPDSTISTGETDAAGNPKRYREIAPWVFRQVNGQDEVAFPVNYTGRRILADDVPIAVGLPVSLLKNSAVNLTLLGITLGVFVLTLLAWPVGAIVRRHYAHTLVLPTRYRRLRLLVRIAALAGLLFVAFWVQFLSGVQGDIARFNSSADGTLRLLQLLALLGALGVIAAVPLAVRSWSDRSVWRWSAVWNTLIAAAFVWYVVFLLDWHLLTPSLRY